MQLKSFLSMILSILLLFPLVSCSRSTASQDISVKESSSASPSPHPQESVPKPDSPEVANETLDPQTIEQQKNQAKAQKLYEEGLKLYYDRSFDEALKRFNDVLEMEPQNYLALNGKGATYAFKGRHNEGIALIQQAIQLKPDFVYARFNLGLAYELAGNYEESIRAYKEALKLDDKDVWSYYGIASIYGRKGDVEKVIEWLRPAIDLEPDVKAVARDERDFNPVKNDPRFVNLIKD